HNVDGKPMTLCVHRKGATRAFPPGHSEIPPEYRAVGQPVLIPGDMGTNSYVLVGTEQAMGEAFGSTCHDAGRVMSRGEIFDSLWAGDGTSSENIVDVYIGYLRKKLSPPEDFAAEIRTVRNKGFVFSDPGDTPRPAGSAT
ncbi:hypothetical protein LCGC14_2074170, partial [marine sediment metagenome]